MATNGGVRSGRSGRSCHQCWLLFRRPLLPNEESAGAGKGMFLARRKAGTYTQSLVQTYSVHTYIPDGWRRELFLDVTSDSLDTWQTRPTTPAPASASLTNCCAGGQGTGHHHASATLHLPCAIRQSFQSVSAHLFLNLVLSLPANFSPADTCIHTHPRRLPLTMDCRVVQTPTQTCCGLPDVVSLASGSRRGLSCWDSRPINLKQSGC